MFNNPESAINIWIFPKNSANQEIPGESSDLGVIIYAEKECVTDVSNKFNITSEYYSSITHDSVTGKGGKVNIIPKDDTKDDTYYCKLSWKNIILDKKYKITIVTTMNPDPPMNSFTMESLDTNGTQIVVPKQQLVAKYSSSVASDPTNSYKVYQGALGVVEKDSGKLIQTIATFSQKLLKGSTSFLAPEEEGEYVFYLYEGVIAPSNITATPTLAKTHKMLILTVKK